MPANGEEAGHVPFDWMRRIQAMRRPPDLMSDRIKGLVSRALVGPGGLTDSEVRELAASVVFHLARLKQEEQRQLE